LSVLGMQPRDVRASDTANREEGKPVFGSAQLRQDRAAAAFPNVDGPTFGGASEGRGEAEILLEAHVTLLADAQRSGGNQEVHIDAVGRADDMQTAAALADQLPDEGH